MKSTIKTLVVAMVLGTASVAASAELSSVPVSPAEQTDTHSVATATSSVPLHALSRLDAQSLAEQEMTDQELKAVEGGHSHGPLWPMKYDGSERSSGGGWAGAVASASVGN